MRHFGVRRMAVINSGRYSYAVVDLNIPIHLAARNNHGKSTLVNALQFLYIDDIKKMSFGTWNHSDSANHYFGQERSYLIFECLTPTGLQCMLVRGINDLSEGRFERYIYDGAFQQSHYVEDGEILSFDSVRTRLAGCQLTRVKNSVLWQVLGNDASKDNGAALPRLNILPIRNQTDYRAFRNVFVLLLSLSNADARILRKLIIDSHAQEIGERKIDVAADYKRELEQADYSEQGLEFIRSVAGDVEAGRTLRLEIHELTEGLRNGATVALNDAARSLRVIARQEEQLKTRLTGLQEQDGKTRASRESCLIQKGRLEQDFRSVECQWNDLCADHKMWSSYSDQFIQQMRANLQTKTTEVALLDQSIDQAAKLDTNALRKAVERLQLSIASDKRMAQEWSNTAAAQLRKAGISESELDSAFRIVNPDLLKLVLGKTLRVIDRESAISQIRNLAGRVRDGIYEDGVVEIDTRVVAGLSSAIAVDEAELRQQIMVQEGGLASHLQQLEAALDHEAACEKRDNARQEMDTLRRELDAYDRYAEAWSHRAEIEKRMGEAGVALEEVEKQICDFAAELERHCDESKQINEQLKIFDQLRGKLDQSVKGLTRELDQVGIPFRESMNWETKEAGRDAEPEELSRYVDSVLRSLLKLASDAQGIGDRRGKLGQLQYKISAQSQQFETHRRTFNDPNEDWQYLIESLESQSQLEEVVAKNWNYLFTTLGARFKGIITAVHSIKIAVERISRALKSYKVSNLRAVEIRVEESEGIYGSVEALAGADGLFQDQGETELAKRRLRLMIDHNETIELESLFQLVIRIQEADGSWRNAASLDEVGSTGTGMTAKAMIFIQLVRAIAGDEQYRLHFYIDNLGDLDEGNIAATTQMAISKGIIPITADPRIHLDSLAHPEVTVYTLGSEGGRFCIDKYRTYRAQKRAQVATKQ